MRRRLAVAGIAVVLATPLLASSAPAPRIQVEPESFDFGRVRPRRTLRKQFRLLNLGERPLQISAISRSCGCTRAEVGQATLEPGTSTTLHVELETRASTGRIEQQVLLRSNDPQTPVLEVKLTATVVTD